MRTKIIIFLSFLLSGCMTIATFEDSVRYQVIKSNSISGGYAVYQLSDDLYQVYYATNPQWVRLGNEKYGETVWLYLSVTAAGLTLQQGYDYFVIINNSTASDRALDEQVAAVNQIGWGNVHFLTIRLGKGKVPQGVERAYAASQYLMLQELRILGDEYMRMQQQNAQ